MPIRNSKQVKLQSKYRKLAYGHKTVPCLNVSGVWLAKLGFKVGDTVRILTREKLLIIEILEDKGKTNQNQEKQTPKKRIR